MFVVDRQSHPVDGDELIRLAELALQSEGLPDRCEVTINLVTDDEMADLNRRFMGREGPTDVLAFPLEELVPGRVVQPSAHEPPLLLGDVFIAPAYVARQAETLGVAYADELRLMLVHGLLHLVGYDHVTEEEAAVMEERERSLLSRVGVSRR